MKESRQGHRHNSVLKIDTKTKSFETDMLFRQRFELCSVNVIAMSAE
jgi:hypothetical protein